MKYNVLSAVVDLIDADTEDEAVSLLDRKLRAAGFEPYEGFEELLPDDYKLAFRSSG
jgi:hypothetical protein